jgi:hypothetical protein
MVMTTARRTVDPRPGTTLLREATAMNPEHHRALAAIVHAGCPDVEHEAVLVESFRRIGLRGENIGEPHVLR